MNMMFRCLKKQQFGDQRELSHVRSTDYWAWIISRWSYFWNFEAWMSKVEREKSNFHIFSHWTLGLVILTIC